ncbi:MAG: DciA family protein, partial [Janthinobacterium lividum]
MPVVPPQEVGGWRSWEHGAGMASDDAGGKEGAGKEASERVSRFYSGPRSIGALLPAITRPVFRSRSAGAAQLMADWPVIVGPALAAVSVPRQLARGSLTLACSG